MIAAQMRLVHAERHDVDELVDIRIEAMRESLERIGRFDPMRARDRFTLGFEPLNTRFIELNQKRVGFVVLSICDDAFLLDHFYIRPQWQGTGVGSSVIKLIIEEAETKGLPIKVGALKESDSNRFYMRHGFEYVESSEFDNHYIRLSSGDNSAHNIAAKPYPSIS